MEKKVNLGCGPVGKDDWINVDWGILAILHRIPLLEKILLKTGLFPKGYNVKWPKNLKLHNCRKKLPFKDESVDFIYTSHFLEHFKKFEAEKIVRDCFRVLKPGGTIRVTVPDLEILIRKYIEKDTRYFQKIFNLMNFNATVSGKKEDLLLGDILMDNFYPAFYRKEAKGVGKLLNKFVRPHFWMYDYNSLKKLLEDSGFSLVERFDYGKGRVPDLEVLDVFPEMTLYVEAKKCIR
jgi:SAM-dependent methyltransferase